MARLSVAFFQGFISFFSPARLYEPYERRVGDFVYKQLGQRPKRLHLYTQAMTHRSCSVAHEAPHVAINERLEYLGDAVLDLVVAEFLFKHYPHADEGVLTDMRSKIVNTMHLAELSEKLGLATLVRFNGGGPPSKGVIGDALEAFIGALYLDQGTEAAKYFILRRLLKPYVCLETLYGVIFNYRGKLAEWAHQYHHALSFDTMRVPGAPASTRYCATLYIDEKLRSKAHASSKKEAQRLAAKAICDQEDVLGAIAELNRSAS